MWRSTNQVQPFDGLVAFTGFHGSSDLQQAVGDFRQCRDDDDRRIGAWLP